MDNRDNNTSPAKPRSFGDKFLRLAGMVILLTSAAAGWLVIDYQAFTKTHFTVPAEGVMLEVMPGRSVRGIANDLANQGLLKNPYYFEWMVRRSGSASRLQAGEYQINPGTYPQALIQLLISGKVLQYSLTIVEGWTFRQMLAAMRAVSTLKHTVLDKSDADIMAALGHAGEHPEGRFLPDTYFFPRDTTDVAFLARAYDALTQTLDREWAARSDGLPLKTPYEALILASIIEKETGIADERARISGVFVRRLLKGMRLQTDPTVIYGLGDSYDGDIRFSDLRKDTAYNTYTRNGLPPTPIALAGVESIHAALNPAEGNELYFVASGGGGHQFSATLAEHNKAVRKYQMKRRPLDVSAEKPPE